MSQVGCDGLSTPLSSGALPGSRRLNPVSEGTMLSHSHTAEEEVLDTRSGPSATWFCASYCVMGSFVLHPI